MLHRQENKTIREDAIIKKDNNRKQYWVEKGPSSHIRKSSLKAKQSNKKTHSAQHKILHK